VGDLPGDWDSALAGLYSDSGSSRHGPDLGSACAAVPCSCVCRLTLLLLLLWGMGRRGAGHWSQVVSSAPVKGGALGAIRLQVLALVPARMSRRGIGVGYLCDGIPAYGWRGGKGVGGRAVEGGALERVGERRGGEARQWERLADTGEGLARAAPTPGTQERGAVVGRARLDARACIECASKGPLAPPQCEGTRKGKRGEGGWRKGGSVQ